MITIEEKLSFPAIYDIKNKKNTFLSKLAIKCESNNNEYSV